MLHTMLRYNDPRLKIGLPDNEIGLPDNGFGRNLSSDRPSAGQRADFDVFKVRIQPRFGLEARSLARKVWW